MAKGKKPEIITEEIIANKIFKAEKISERFCVRCKQTPTAARRC
jgi:hypothetical protein